MDKATERRRSRFLRALAADGGKSLTAWATERELSKAHVSLVLRGERDSARLTQRIDEYIGQHLHDKRALAS